MEKNFHIRLPNHWLVNFREKKVEARKSFYRCSSFSFIEKQFTEVYSRLFDSKVIVYSTLGNLKIFTSEKLKVEMEIIDKLSFDWLS